MGKYLTISKAREKYKVRKAFDVYLDDRLCTVYDIDGYHHVLGEMNDSPTTWWLDHTEEPVRGEFNFERELTPYINKGNNRICWEIRYKQNNYLKHKWDEYDLRANGKCEIYANGKLIYSFASRDLGYAMSKAQALTIELLEHPYNFINPENEIDRKIWYYGLPAKVKPSQHHPGEISIYPDYENISKKEWWKYYKERKNPIETLEKSEYYTEEDRDFDESGIEEFYDFGAINHGDAMWDGMINWFR